MPHPIVMEVAAQALQFDAARLERISANLANALTPGYKREVLVQRADRAIDGAPGFAAVLSAGSMQAGRAALAVETHRDDRPATLRSTGATFDVALAGPGFFEIAAPGGPQYTRNGQFRLDERGRLVNAQGHAVLGHAGEIVLLPGPVAIDAGGIVRQAGRPVDQLRVVAFDAASAARAGGAAARTRLVDAADLQVRQGFLENANVNAMHEMVELMRATRHFESMSRVLQSHDQMLGSALRQLGEF